MPSFGEVLSDDIAGAVRLRFAPEMPLAWRHSGLSADFLAGLFAMGAEGAARENIRHSLSYLVNELLENALKFRSGGEVMLAARFHGGEFALEVRNSVSPDVAVRFMRLLEEVLAGDPGDLLIARIEANAANPSAGGSGLGLLTLMNDYGARLGWEFSDEPTGAIMLRTTARLGL